MTCLRCTAAIKKLDIFIQYSDAIWVPDHLTLGHNSTIQLPDNSGFQMFTVCIYLENISGPDQNIFGPCS
jgi:hypothetical protein